MDGNVWLRIESVVGCRARDNGFRQRMEFLD